MDGGSTDRGLADKGGGMGSLVKKGFNLSKAVYSAVNDVVSHPEQWNGQGAKPQLQQQNQTSYPPTQIPGVYTAAGQAPALPPRPSPPTQNYSPSNAASQQFPYGASHSQPGQPQPLYYPPPPPRQSHVQAAPQTHGTVPTTASSPQTQPAWTPPPGVHPTGPLQSHTAYVPPNSSSAPPIQPFPSQFPHRLSDPPVSPLTAPTPPFSPLSNTSYPTPVVSPSPTPSYPTAQTGPHISSPPPPPASKPQPSPPVHFSPPPPQPPHHVPAHTQPTCPAAFIAELPGNIPSGPVELPAEMPASGSAKLRQESQGSVPVIPASSVTPSTMVEQPRPVHPPAHASNLSFAPYASNSASPQSNPQIQYQPYHPPQPAVPGQENDFGLPTPPPPPGQYIPYSQPAPYTHSSGQHVPLAPQSSLAKKLSQLNMNNSHT